MWNQTTIEFQVWDFVIGDKQSLPTRSMVIGVVQTVACSLRGRGGKNLVHCMVLERPKFRFCWLWECFFFFSFHN